VLKAAHRRAKSPKSRFRKRGKGIALFPVVRCHHSLLSVPGLLGVLLLGACQGLPVGIVDNTNGPQRGNRPPGDQVVPDATVFDPSGGPDAAVDASDGNPVKDGPPSLIDTNPRVDVEAVVEAKPPVEAGPPPVDAQDTGGGQVACRPPDPGEIDLWVSGVGNCSYPVGELPVYAAAVDSELYATGAACGVCLEVSSNRGKVIATVVDQYPVSPGAHGHKISLSNAALLQVAAPGTSVASMNWRWVPCPVSGPIMAALKNGSHQFYWAVMLKSAVNRVVKVESLTGADTTWRAAKLENDGFFLGDSKITGLPARLRLTDVVGNTVTTGNLTWPTNPVTQTTPLDVQFPPACAL
jgi:expansin (peptidoglycan-binding protein)